MDLTEIWQICLGLLTTILIAVGRTFIGWFENAIQDGVFSDFEKQQLYDSLFRVTLITGCLYFGVSQLFGMDVSVVASAISAMGIDYVLMKVKPKKAKAPKKAKIPVVQDPTAPVDIQPSTVTA